MSYWLGSGRNIIYKGECMSRNKEYVECKICGAKIKNVGQHLYYSHKDLDIKTYYDLYIKQENEEICPTCGQPNHFQSFRKGYTKHCCPKCAQIDKDVRTAQAKTNLNKYGHTCALSSTQAKQKTNNTKLLRYGSSTYNNPKKMKQTKLDKYGEYYVNPEKTKSTNLERYGVECTFQSRDARLKALSTMRKNGNRSSYEDKLEKFFLDNGIKFEQEWNKDPRYPYHCDFYLPDSDTFIEVNVYWTHGKHFFNSKNKRDLETLSTWKAKAEQGLKQYQSAIHIWTELDPQKKKCAVVNKLKYVVLWNKQDVDNFIDKYEI